MTSPSDSFSASFDAIALDATTAPSAAAIEAALSACASHDAPGFYLLDDADGRFCIDRDFGVVSLRSETILEAERDRVHVARLLVIEHSGERYELALRLKLTGMVPQAVVADDKARPAATPWPQFRAWEYSTLADRFADERAAFGALLMWPLPAQADQAADLSLAYPLASAARDAVWAP
ncbi:MAG: hypothetical protein K2P58_05255 [Hyphomonadaceae bacterium]|nr:hypothetical protein [Hyphomonadaceae bacterium]